MLRQSNSDDRQQSVGYVAVELIGRLKADSGVGVFALACAELDRSITILVLAKDGFLLRWNIVHGLRFRCRHSGDRGTR